MWKTFALTGACCFLSLTASAQTTARSSAGHSSPTIAPPPDEPGKTTVQLSNGYIRFQTDDADETDGGEDVSAADEGSFSVMPKSPEPQAAESKGAVAASPVAAAPAPAAAEPMPARPPVIQVPQVETNACLNERAALAQRLLQTRGIYLDPQSALITLPQIEVPFSPILTRSFFGAPTPYIGGSILSSAISWDTETQQLTDKLAHCLLH